MNTLIAKKAMILSVILGAVLGITGSFNFLIMLAVFLLGVLAAPAVIFIMKKKNEIGFLENQQAAALGGLIGFCSTVGFFVVFTPLTLLMLAFSPLINKIFPALNYYHYAYGLQVMVRPDTLWLFIIIIIMLAATAAMTNAASAMGFWFLLSQFEKKPDDIEEIDMHIE